MSERYVYDGNDLIGVLDATNSVQRRFSFGTGIDEPLRMADSTGTCYFHANHLESVMALSASAGVVSQYSYEPYGKTRVAGEASNSFRYTAREQDGEDLYYYRARYYDPTRQRFISEDPIGLAGGLNLYSHVGNNPIRYVDPKGLGPWDKLYGFGREFWHWFHGLDGGDLMKELKDPATKQVPKDAAQPYYDEWKAMKDKEGGWIDPVLIPELLIPFTLTPSPTGGCDANGNCSDMKPPQWWKNCK